MGKIHQRSVKSRQPNEIRGAIGFTIILGVVGGWFFGYNRSISSPTFVYFLIVLFITIGTWVWAIHSVCARNAAGKTLQELQALSPDEFEEWVAARFKELGYSVKTVGIRGDHGVDIVAQKDGEIAVVQCKKFKTSSVGEPMLRDLYGAMTDLAASRAFLVTTGRLTRPAKEWVKGKPIEVWDGDYVAKLSMRQKTAKRVDNNRQLATTPSTPIEAPSVAADIAEQEDISKHPRQATCPKCDVPLVERWNRATGQPFLACPNYPDCRHTESR